VAAVLNPVDRTGRNITRYAVVEEADGGGTYPGYHTRKVAASDHLPRGDMTGTVSLTG
jgi:hypothetical protein